MLPAVLLGGVVNDLFQQISKRESPFDRHCRKFSWCRDSHCSSCFKCWTLGELTSLRDKRQRVRQCAAMYECISPMTMFLMWCKWQVRLWVYAYLHVRTDDRRIKLISGNLNFTIMGRWFQVRLTHAHTPLPYTPTPLQVPRHTQIKLILIKAKPGLTQ